MLPYYWPDFFTGAVKGEFLHKVFGVVKSTTPEKVGRPSKAVASFYVNPF